MRICFITYWGLNEGLTQATVLPHLKILSESASVNSIDFVSMERNGNPLPLHAENKLRHYPLVTSHSPKDKLFDKARFTVLIKKIYSIQKPDLIFARGSMAAWLIQDFAKKNDIPLSIESFEPHAQYMLEDGIWSKFGIKYRTLKKAEESQVNFARFILPVTDAFRKQLVENQKVEKQKLLTMPCCVDTSLFQFQNSDRARIRTQLEISEERVVGIYTGKLGGIYLDEEAISLFRQAKSFYRGKFFLIVLSPDQNLWQNRLSEAGFNDAEFHVSFVKQIEVPGFLSASDFAFSLHRPTPSKIAISPIKNAEFWANGLPIIMPAGIGDDSHAAESENIGVVINNLYDINESIFAQIDDLRKGDRLTNNCVSFAREHRSFDIVKSCYAQILKGIQ